MLFGGHPRVSVMGAVADLWLEDNPLEPEALHQQLQASQPEPDQASSLRAVGIDHRQVICWHVEKTCWPEGNSEAS